MRHRTIFINELNRTCDGHAQSCVGAFELDVLGVQLLLKLRERFEPTLAIEDVYNIHDQRSGRIGGCPTRVTDDHLSLRVKDDAILDLPRTWRNDLIVDGLFRL